MRICNGSNDVQRVKISCSNENSSFPCTTPPCSESNTVHMITSESVRVKRPLVTPAAAFHNTVHQNPRGRWRRRFGEERRSLDTEAPSFSFHIRPSSLPHTRTLSLKSLSHIARRTCRVRRGAVIGAPASCPHPSHMNSHYTNTLNKTADRPPHHRIAASENFSSRKEAIKPKKKKKSTYHTCSSSWPSCASRSSSSVTR